MQAWMRQTEDTRGLENLLALKCAASAQLSVVPTSAAGVAGAGNSRVCFQRSYWAPTTRPSVSPSFQRPQG
ncbi:hypothetical protein [Nannocystis pusilla]|uniref:hypothetical protein n=1 Tax=Nannocystis pusilla TaxID=889268 RepID=UPI003B7FB04A